MNRDAVKKFSGKWTVAGGTPAGTWRDAIERPRLGAHRIFGEPDPHRDPRAGEADALADAPQRHGECRVGDADAVVEQHIGPIAMRLGIGEREPPILAAPAMDGAGGDAVRAEGAAGGEAVEEGGF